MALKPFEWQDKPALIEHLFPVQKISAESYKEQEARQGKTLTSLGSYWKGRKPLVLNKACILGSLLPVTNDHLKDLEIFELLMGMDFQSIQERLKKNLPTSKHDTIEKLMASPYSQQAEKAKRPEEMGSSLFSHIWKRVNKHLGTLATSFPELVEQIGIARFGHRPQLGDVFTGSGQIPFEAARLGCNVYASDINPVACMLTWGAFNIVGTSQKQLNDIIENNQLTADIIKKEVSLIDPADDGDGWEKRFFLYCVEVICPETYWKVPLLPNKIISHDAKIVIDLIPVSEEKRYDINVRPLLYNESLADFKIGTQSKGEITHSPDGISSVCFKVSTIRGDFKDSGITQNKLRYWTKTDFTPIEKDVFQERLYCIQRIRHNANKKSFEFDFRSITYQDVEIEEKIKKHIKNNITKWQENGYIPDMIIEAGNKTDEPIRTRGWTHWHHLFNPRQLLIMAITNKHTNAAGKLALASMLNWNARLSRWDRSQIGGGGSVKDVFYNQALNTLFDYGCRSVDASLTFMTMKFPNYPLSTNLLIASHSAKELQMINDIYITDPPYGDAVKYEEITEFFIAWLRKNTPEEFQNWTWDSKRALAIKGEDDDFRRNMIVAYSKMREMMPYNGIQILMFTHQSGSIWADMASIIWASGLQVTAAWYVVTETNSALRQGANIKGTIILVLRKRHQSLEAFRDDLGWEIEEAVKEQVESLIGLDEKVRAQGAEGLYTDADLQMAGYAAALKVLTAYSSIDGKNMVTEAEAPRQKGQKSFVDELIDFAVYTAVQFLVPFGFEKNEWQKLTPAERFYLKMAEMEYQGSNTLDNYQNFAKAFQVRHFDQLMSDSSKANAARLKLSFEFKGAMMSGDAEIAGTPLRALLYALFELYKEIDPDDVLLHLMENCPNYQTNKVLLAKMADYLAEKRENLKSGKTFKPDAEAGAARVLAEAIRNQRL